MGQPRGRTAPDNISMTTSQISKVFVTLFLAQTVHSSAVHHPAPHHGYGQPKYEYPKHNCSVEQVEEQGETCTPTFTTVCEPVTVTVKKIVDAELCYPVTKTVCSEDVQVVDNELCVYAYEAKAVDTEAKTVEVVYTTPCNTQMVTGMTFIAKRLLRRLVTTHLLLRMTSSLKQSSSLNQSSSASRSPLTWLLSPAKTLCLRSVSPFLRLRRLRRPTRCAGQRWESQTATPWPWTYPGRGA